MSKLIRILAAILFLQSAPYALADGHIDLEANLTGVWFGLDDSRCYVRQYEQHERQLVSIFCENPYEQSSYVFNGYKLDSRSEEHTSELQSPCNLVCRLLLEKKNTKKQKF